MANNYAVLKGTSYILGAVPDLLKHYGSTQIAEKITNPQSEYLQNLDKHLRSYDQILEYLPNQVYIGNENPFALNEIEFPWYKHKTNETRYGKFGEIMPQDEFYGLMQIVDVFDLVVLEETFAQIVKAKLEKDSIIPRSVLSKVGHITAAKGELKTLLADEAVPLYNMQRLVGVIKKAHGFDPNLTAEVMAENIISKASNVLSVWHLMKSVDVPLDEIDYIIDCSEEACGDMNQRGGGSFAKAVAEIAGLQNATGEDVRSFCSGPAHAIVTAASLVKAGTFRNVIVSAGGCSAKLGMNGKDQVRKAMPLLEDVLGGFAFLISEDDGLNPQIRNDVVGRHTVGAGASPQAVTDALVVQPLRKAGFALCDIDKYAVELQNPDITKPSGAGDVTESNYKMIAAMAVKYGEIERSSLTGFIVDHGMKGWAPTQGHIPSGVPYLGFAKEALTTGTLDRVFVIGKGSLFLGRITSLFDGLSFLLQRNENS